MRAHSVVVQHGVGGVHKRSDSITQARRFESGLTSSSHMSPQQCGLSRFQLTVVRGSDTPTPPTSSQRPHHPHFSSIRVVTPSYICLHTTQRAADI